MAKFNYLLLILFSAIVAHGQQFLMKNPFSNYGGFYAALNNPARAAASPHIFHSNGIGYGFEISNNYIGLNAPFSAWDYLQGNVPDEYKGADGRIQWQDDWFQENLNGEPKYGQLNMITQGPSFLFSYQKWGIAIGTANHTSLKIFNVAEPLARLTRLKNFSLNALTDTAGTQVIDNNFSIVANAYQEFSASFGYLVHDNGPLKVKAGLGFRFLLGLGYGEFNNNGIDLRFYDQDSIVMRSANFNAAYSNPQIFNDFRSDILNFDRAGTGYALSFGASVEWNPDALSPLFKPERYKFRFGVALSNIGAITYDRQVTKLSASLNNPIVINPQDTAFLSSFAASNSNGIAFLDSVVRNNMTVTSEDGSMKIALPYNLQLDFDWNVFKGFYLGVIPNIAINSSGSFNFRNLSNYIFLPRFESRFIEVSVPLMYTQGIGRLQMGTMIRLGPVFFGTNDLGFITRNEPINNVGFYFGLAAGLLRKNNQDQNINY